MAITRIDRILIILLIIQCFIVIASDYEDCIEPCEDDLEDCTENCEEIRDDCYQYNTTEACNIIFNICEFICDSQYDSCASVCEGIDEDGDGVGDHNDSVIGTETDVSIEGFSNLSVYVGSYQSNESGASNLDTTETVTFLSENGPVLEFDQDFNQSQLNLVDIEIKKETRPSGHGIVVKGLNESTVPDKALYLLKTRDDSAVCIKDAEIDSIDDISRDCTGDDEFYFGKCEDIESIDDYTCTIESGQYKIDGLKHSGAVELNISGVFSGFFTVKYHTEAPSHRDGYLMPGEGISICFESARPILADEHLRLVFVPRIGGLTINQMYTPPVISNYNTHIYP